MRLHELVENTSGAVAAVAMPLGSMQRRVPKKKTDEDAPALVRGAAGLAVGGIAAAGTPALIGLLGPVLGIGIGAAGAYNASKFAMAGADKLWDWAAKKLGGSEEDFAFAHIRAAAAGKDEFEHNGKTYPVTLKKNQIQPAIQAVKQVAESKIA